MKSRKIICILISIVVIMSLFMPIVFAIETSTNELEQEQQLINENKVEENVVDEEYKEEKEEVKKTEEKVEESTEPNDEENIVEEKEEPKVEDNTKVRTMSLSNQPLPDGIYEIKAGVGNNKYLDVYGALTSDEANLQIWEKNGNANQQFKITYSNGYYTIVAVHSGKALDVYKALNINATNVDQFTLNNFKM